MREIRKNVTLRCQNCGRSFEAQKSTAEYCSGRCRAAASRRRKAQAQEERDRRLQRLVEVLAREMGLRVEDL